MIIKIAGLSEGSHFYRFEEPVQNLDIEKIYSDNIIVDVELNKSHHQLILNGDIKGRAIFECDRCTKNFMQDISTSYRVVYLFGNKPDGDQDLNVIYLSHEADKIEIDPEVRDYALLAVPMKKLCNENCKGLCPRCGKDLNEGSCECETVEVDSRWLPLMELKKKLSNN